MPFIIHWSAQNLSKINAMINPLVVESLTVNNNTRRRNILSVNTVIVTAGDFEP
jgi:hypothetical protein